MIMNIFLEKCSKDSSRTMSLLKLNNILLIESSVKIQGKFVLVGMFLFSLISGIQAVEADPGTSELTVHSQYGSNEISGYYTVLSQNGIVLETDFTPATFTVNDDELYNVAVHSFEDFEFLMWQDTGSAISNKDLSISSSTPFKSNNGRSPE